MIKRKSTKNFLLWTTSILCVGLFAAATSFACLLPKTTVAKAEESGVTATDVSKAVAWTSGTENAGMASTEMLFYLTAADYMTAEEWGTDSTAAYKWLFEGELAYEDRLNNNVPNAKLDKNLDDYNFEDKIFIDGVALSEFDDYQWVANAYTRVDTLSLRFSTNVIGQASEIIVEAGCQLPTLTHSYFGLEEFSCLEIPESLRFTNNNGVWAKRYAFAGYEMGAEYDASDRFFYTRPHGSTYKGHLEAPTYEVTDVFSRNDWGDDGYALASTSDTVKGSLFVAELVNPIDAATFSLLDIRFYSNVPRILVSRNASSITPDGLGEVIEMFQIPSGFSTVTLMSPLYVNESGEIDTLVFEFLDNGSEDKGQNQFFLCSFTCREMLVTTPVYDQSFLIWETEDYYDLTFRFNKKGDFDETVEVDTTKVVLNDVAISDFGSYVTARWAEVQGIYQIVVRLDKAYQGAGQLRNPEYNYSNNKMSVKEGLTFPNGEKLDREYTCHQYSWETYVDYELLKNYRETEVVEVTAFIDHNSADNLHFRIVFDVQITSQIYYHACENEGWRSSELPKYNLYDETFTNVFIAGGFKSSLYDNIILNGKSIGQIHTEDSWTNCVFVQYGQTNLYTLDFNVDSNSATYDEMYALYMSGTGIELEIKAGMKFTTGYKTMEDVKYVLSGDVLYNVAEKGDMRVFFDGQEVKDGDTIVSETTARQDGIAVEGVVNYTITESVDGNVKTYVIEGDDGQKLTFSVQEDVAPTPVAEDEGCGSVLSGGLLGVLAVTSIGAAAVVMRKKNDEK